MTQITEIAASNREKLVRMANQIAGFFATQPGETQIIDTAHHLREFWDPAMRADLADIVAEGAAGLSDAALAAAKALQALK